jgi:RNA polymerase sigma-70 factor, ECF subfamily
MRPSEGGRGGSASEFDLFYAATGAKILHQLVLLTGDLAEAEDVTQEAFERAWLGWSSVRDCESPEAWVRTVARRIAVSRWRRLRNSSTAWLRRGAGAEPEVLDDDHVVLTAALRQLPAKQRVAIVLHHLADLPVELVAEETGASVSAVKQQLVRGRAGLAVLLADEPPSHAVPVVDEIVRGGEA